MKKRFDSVPTCCWVTVPGEMSFFLPQCWGGVNYGPEGCYCFEGGLEPDKEGLEARIQELKREIRRLQFILRRPSRPAMGFPVVVDKSLCRVAGRQPELDENILAGIVPVEQKPPTK